MTWRTARLAAVLALCGLGCGRSELILAGASTEASSEGGTVSTGGTVGLDSGGFDTGRPTTTGLDSGGFDTGRPITTGLDTGGPITVTATFTTGFDTGVPDSGFDSMPESGFEETGFPGTTSGPSTSTSETSATTTTTTTNGSDTDGSTTSVGTTDGGTTDGATTSAGTTDGGTTDGGTTSAGTTDGGTTDGDPTGGDPSCLDAVDCVIACGGASFECINQCNDGLAPDEASAFNDLETCIIFACIFNGACGFGGFDSPECVGCRIDGQLDPALLACDDEAMSCL